MQGVYWSHLTRHSFGRISLVTAPMGGRLAHLHLVLVRPDVNGAADDALLAEQLLRLLSDGVLLHN